MTIINSECLILIYTVQEIRTIKTLKASYEKNLTFFSNTYAKTQMYLQTTTTVCMGLLLIICPKNDYKNIYIM